MNFRTTSNPSGSNKRRNRSGLQSPSARNQFLLAMFGMLGLLTAVRLHHRIGGGLLAVLPGEFDVGPRDSPTEIAAVDDQALLAALHAQDDFGERRVGSGFDRGSDPTLGGVDPGSHLDVN